MTALLFSLGLLLTVFPARAQLQAPPGYRISGVVFNAVTGAPVPGAEVSIFHDTEETKTTTADDGRFVFQDLEAAKYTLFATAQGYVREGLDQHGAFFTGITVGNGLDSEHVIFRLHPQAIIAGKVTDEHGEAVRLAQVMLFSTDNPGGGHATFMQAQMQTNDLGEYRFARLQPGKYYVAVVARPWYAQMGLRYLPASEPGNSPTERFGRRPKLNPSLDVIYPITFYPGVTEQQAAGELNLTAGEEAEASIHLLAVPAVHIRVTNLPGQEHTGINIGASEKLFGSLETGLSVEYGQIAPGEYEVAGLPPGDVTLIVNQTVNQGENEGWRSRTIKANVSAGDTLNGAGAGATANVSGRVNFPAGEVTPVQGQVTLLSGDNQSGSAKLQNDGTFSFAALPEGVYKVLVNRQRSDEYVQTVNATGAKARGREITISDAGDVHLSITLGRGVGQVTGMAKLAGKPTAGVMVLLVPQSGENLEEDSRVDQSDSDGTFALRGILPGKYSLLAIDGGWDLEWTNRSALKPYLEKGQTLQISANDQKKVAVEVQHKME